MDETAAQMNDRVAQTERKAKAWVEAGEPEVEPINWGKLDPKLTKAIVAAQGAATTVDNDGHNTHHGYRYPTQAAIACKAREAMCGAGIALIQIGWKRADQGMLYAEFLIVHEDGPVSPVFGATMPVGQGKEPAKQLAAALSVLRKYVLAGLLNMGWRDPTEDVDADNPKGQQRQQQQPRQQGQGQALQPPPRQPTPFETYRHRAIADARSWGKWLLSNGVDKAGLLHYVTGCEGAMPSPPPSSVLEAITTVGALLSGHMSGDDDLPGGDHAGLMSFMDHCEATPLWRDGKRTAAGDSVDAKWPVGR